MKSRISHYQCLILYSIHKEAIIIFIINKVKNLINIDWSPNTSQNKINIVINFVVIILILTDLEIIIIQLNNNKEYKEWGV